MTGEARPVTLAALVAFALLAGCAKGDRPAETSDRAGQSDASSQTSMPGAGVTSSPAAGSGAPPTATGGQPTPASPTRLAPTTNEGTTTTPGTPTASTADTSAERFAPPAGDYTYDVAGTISSGSGPTERQDHPPDRQIDGVRTEQLPTGTRLTISTTTGDETQETEFLVEARQVTLVRLTYRSTTTQTVTPDPPIPVAVLPYRVGDRREFAWQDATVGVQGIGTATVEGTETIATPAGSYRTTVIAVRQRIRGAVTGTISATFWVDPTSGVHARRRVESSFDGVAGGSRSDITSTLRTTPS